MIRFLSFLSLLTLSFALTGWIRSWYTLEFGPVDFGGKQTITVIVDHAQFRQDYDSLRGQVRKILTGNDASPDQVPQDNLGQDNLGQDNLADDFDESSAQFGSGRASGFPFYGDFSQSSRWGGNFSGPDPSERDLVDPQNPANRYGNGFGNSLKELLRHDFHR